MPMSNLDIEKNTKYKRQDRQTNKKADIQIDKQTLYRQRKLNCLCITCSQKI